MLIVHNQAGSIGLGDQSGDRRGAARTGEFWEEEMSVCSCHIAAEEPR